MTVKAHYRQVGVKILVLNELYHYLLVKRFI
jgi:hypothetical protein